jgi:hypothetical protein
VNEHSAGNVDPSAFIFTTFTFTASGRPRTLTMTRALTRNGHPWAVIRTEGLALPTAWATWTRTGPASWISTAHADRIEDEAGAGRWRPPARPDGTYLTAIGGDTGRWADTQHAILTSLRHPAAGDFGRYRRIIRRTGDHLLADGSHAARWAATDLGKAIWALNDLFDGEAGEPRPPAKGPAPAIAAGYLRLAAARLDSHPQARHLTALADELCPGS